jgi:hypothetical protein
MVVRIRLQKGPMVQRKRGKNRRLASAFGALCFPGALMAYVLAFWSLTSDMRMTGEFAIRGLLSHWQVWIAIAASLHALGAALNRYGRGGPLWPRGLGLRPAAPVERSSGV